MLLHHAEQFWGGWCYKQAWTLYFDGSHHRTSDFKKSTKNLQFVLAQEVLTLAYMSGRVLISIPDYKHSSSS